MTARLQPQSRHWFLLLVVGIAGIGLLAGAFVWGNPKNGFRSGVAVDAIAFSPDGQRMAVAGDKVQVWNVSDRRIVQTLKPGYGAYAVAWSPDGESLAVSGSSNAAVDIWATDTYTRRMALQGGTTIINDLAFSADSQLVTAASRDALVRVWRVRDGTLLHTLTDHSRTATSVAFSPNGELLASGGGDGIVRIWRVRDGQLLQMLTSVATGLAFSPDGQLLASGGYGDIKLWEVATGTRLQTLEGHIDLVTDIAFSPNGELLVSGSGTSPSSERGERIEDATVRLWRVRDGESLAIFEGHQDIVTSVAFSPDGTSVASGSWDGTVRFWAVPESAALPRS